MIVYFLSPGQDKGLGRGRKPCCVHGSSHDACMGHEVSAAAQVGHQYDYACDTETFLSHSNCTTALVQAVPGGLQPRECDLCAVCSSCQRCSSIRHIRHNFTDF